METSAVAQILRLLAKYSIIGFVVGHLLALGMRLTVPWPVPATATVNK